MLDNLIIEKKKWRKFKWLSISFCLFKNYDENKWNLPLLKWINICLKWIIIIYFHRKLPHLIKFSYNRKVNQKTMIKR